MRPDVWTRSRVCESNNCVEARYVGDLVQVRSSRWPGTANMFTVDEWRAFLDGVRRGEFDID